MRLSTRYEQCNSVVEGFDFLIHEVQEIFRMLYDAFLQHNDTLFPKAAKKLDAVNKDLRQMMLTIPKDIDQELTETVNELFAHYSSLCAELEAILEVVQEKVRDRVLFSEKAVREIRDLFTAVEALLVDLHDILVTENATLAGQLIDRGRKYQQKALHYTTEHEERLIRGVCMPKSSVLYIKLTDSVERIIRHSNKFARTYIK